MRYRTKLLIAAGLLLAMSLSAAALAYWGVAQSQPLSDALPHRP